MCPIEPAFVKQRRHHFFFCLTICKQMAQPCRMVISKHHFNHVILIQMAQKLSHDNKMTYG